MANIIIIENDQRLINQMKQLLLDLDESQRIRVFHSIEEFQNIYLKQTKKNPPGNIQSNPLFQAFSPEQINWLHTQQWNTTSPFLNNAAKIHLNHQNAILQVDEETLQGGLFFTTKITSSQLPNDLNEWIHPLFATLWQNFIHHLSTQRVISMAFPFVDAEKKYFLLKVSGKRITNEQVQLVFRHQPDVFKPLLNASLPVTSTVESQPEELQLLSTIDLILVRFELINDSPLKWVSTSHQILQTQGFFPDGFRTRWVLTKFETDESEQINLAHPFIDDLIYLPLDRLIFMQKMEILFGLPGKVRPSFLFMQEENRDIELAKLVKMDHLSDSGCSIINPVAIQIGVGVRFKFTLPHEHQMISLLARVYKCEKHPEINNAFQVFFYFFGLDRETLKKLKKFTQSHKNFQPYIDDKDSSFDFDLQNLFLTPQEKEIKNIVVLDASESAAENTVQVIKEEVKQTRIYYETSYYRFLKEYLNDPSLQIVDPLQSAPNENSNSQSTETISLALPREFYAPTVSWTIHSATREMEQVVTPFTEHDFLLGHLATHIFSNKQNWQILFKGKDNENLLDETIKVISVSGKSLKKRFALISTAQSKWVEVDFSPVETSRDHLKITLQPLANNEWMKTHTERPDRLDLLIVNDDLVPQNVESWAEGIQKLALSNHLCSPSQPLKLMIISEDMKRTQELQTKYRNTTLSSLHFKPLDLKSFLAQVAFLIQSPFTKYNFNNQNFIPISIWAHVTKEVRLLGLSEFGSSVIYPTEIKPGAVLYLHEGIFEKSPTGTIAARFYHCEPNPSQKGSFICSFIYYGIKDSFLKFCRTWIRDHYAAKKTGEG